MELRKEILDTLEQDARISPKELAIRLGADEVDVVNEVRYHLRILNTYRLG